MEKITPHVCQVDLEDAPFLFQFFASIVIENIVLPPFHNVKTIQ